MMKSVASCCRILLLLLVAAVAAPAAHAEEGQISITDVRTSNYPNVAIRFTAIGQGGGPIGGLQDKDFVVEENGQPSRSLIVTHGRQSQTRLSIVMAVDVSGSMNDDAKLPKAREAARTFISELRSIDQVELLTFSTGVDTLVPFTNNRAELNKGLDSLTAKGNTALYDATDRAVIDAARVTEGLRVIVLLSDGEDTASKTKLARTLELAGQARIPIYTIGLGADAKDDILTRMAQETGGRYFKAPSPDDLALTFRLVSRQINNTYELVYSSPLTQVGGATVNVVVKLARPEYEGLQARFSYRMPEPKLEEAPVPVDPGRLREVVETPPPAPPPPPSSLPPFWSELAALAAGFGVFAVFSGMILRVTQDPAQVRMSAFVESTVRATGRRKAGEASSKLLSSIIRWMSGLATRFLPSRQVQETRRFLILAGNPYGWGVEEFLGIRVLIGALLAMLGYLLMLSRGPILGLGVAVGFGAIGFLLPVVWLRSRIGSRQREIFKAMPNALDLLAVSVEAGLGFDQALGEVCQKWHNPLTQEFATLLGELQMGRNRKEALRGLMERTDVPELGGFASALIQADELGASIARTLSIQAEQIRIKRRQRAEELAHEAAVKMLFPLVFLMFPSLFIVILGPAVPQILEAFGQVNK